MNRMTLAQAVLDVSPDYDRLYPAGSRLDLEFRAVLAILRTGRLWAKALEQIVAAETGQSRVRLEMLFAMAFAGGPTTATALAQRLDVTWPALVRNLDSLEQEGLIVRHWNPADGRSRLVELAESGWAAIDEMRRCVDPARSEVLSGLSDAELGEVTALVGRIFERLR
jgi:MarR family transcriptional regulator for hemolysin